MQMHGQMHVHGGGLLVTGLTVAKPESFQLRALSMEETHTGPFLFRYDRTPPEE